MRKIFVESLLAGLILGSSTALNAQATPALLSIGPEEFLWREGRLPTIATDSRNQPHVVLDIVGECAYFMHSRINGFWVPSGKHIVATNGSPQFHNPHLEINGNDIGVLSGVMWHPYGMGFVLISNISTNPEVTDTWTKNGSGGGLLPIGNISLDPGRPNEMVVYYGNGGRWHIEPITSTGTRTPAADELDGQLNGALQGGEKNYFWISKAGNIYHPMSGSHGIWHACTEQYYQSSLMHESGQGVKRWADWQTYPAMQSDHTYPGMCSDNEDPETVYFIADYELHGTQGIVFNVYTKRDGMVFSSNNLPSLHVDGTSGLPRFEPQIYPAQCGGAWAVYSANGTIRVSYIPSDISAANWRTELQHYPIAPGTLADVCVDNAGNLHVVYSNNGIYYRKMTIQGDHPDLLTEASLNVAPQALPTGMEMSAYNTQLLATNGAAPYYWFTNDPSTLPEGIQLDSDGAIFGVPTLATTNQLPLTVVDANGAFTNLQFILTIEPNANHRPRIDSKTPGTDSVSLGEQTNMLFSVTASDPENAACSYRWTLDGADVGTLSSNDLITTWGDAGYHLLRCFVNDETWNNQVFAEWAITVLDDNDYDGVSNELEHRAGTNPNDRNSLFSIKDLEKTGFMNRIVFNSVPGKTYYVTASPSLDGYWARIGGPLTATGTETTWEGLLTDTNNCYYLQIKLEEP